MVFCFKCHYDLDHPFHDDGAVNEACDLSQFRMPNWHIDKDGKPV